MPKCPNLIVVLTSISALRATLSLRSLCANCKLVEGCTLDITYYRREANPILGGVWLSLGTNEEN